MMFQFVDNDQIRQRVQIRQTAFVEILAQELIDDGLGRIQFRFVSNGGEWVPLYQVKVSIWQRGWSPLCP